MQQASLSGTGQDPDALKIEPVGRWLAALIRASSELLDVYVISGRAPREPVICGAQHFIVKCAVSGSTRGEVRCRIDAQLAMAVAEGMWAEPSVRLSEGQILDAVQELCGQIIGYAAGEVSTHLPGVIFEPPRIYEVRKGQTQGDLGLLPLRGGDRAVVPVRCGALQWEVSEMQVEADAGYNSPHQAITVRDRIRALRDTDLYLLRAVQVLGVDDAADDAFEQLVRAVGSDPALSARILRRVNSAMTRPRGARIQSLPQALLYLGTRAAKNLVVSALLSQPVGPPHPARGRVVAHSIHVGILSRYLGPLCKLDADECYLLGLLHDLGRLILDRLYPEETAELSRMDERTMLAHEVKTLGITHAEASAIVAMAWRFPDLIRLVMTAHHDAEVIGELGLPPEQSRPIQVVAQADRLAERWEQGGYAAAEAACAEAAAVLNRSSDVIRDCLLRAFEQFKEDLLDDAV